MDRGDVYTTDHRFPDGTVKSKHWVYLVGQHAPGVKGGGQVSVVIANSDPRKAPKRALRPHEVALGTADGFHHETLIDCRWVPVKTWDSVQGARHLLTLGADAMKRIDKAIEKGLGLKL